MSHLKEYEYEEEEEEEEEEEAAETRPVGCNQKKCQFPY